jgi:hypothetical protein
MKVNLSSIVKRAKIMLSPALKGKILIANFA